MTYTYNEPNLQSVLKHSINESNLSQEYLFGTKEALLTIAWNIGSDQKVMIDEVEYEFPSQHVLPLIAANSFKFSKPADIIAWQFNREFYCILDHDQEVSCAGFIFYGDKDHMMIALDNAYQIKIEMLHQIFVDEFSEKDNIQGEMLRMLLKRLIILITRLGKKQYYRDDSITNDESDLVRQFNISLDANFRELHQVQDYANLLNKSPKTLSNIFSKYSEKTPLQLIKERIILEAKRLLYYTDKTSKEIAFDLGFEDPASFSRLFKNATGTSPSSFKNNFVERNN